MNDDDDRIDAAHDRLLDDLARAPALPEDAIDTYVAAGLRRRATPSARELMVLQCLSRGLTAEMAAAALGRSPATIKSQLQSARALLGAKNTTHACAEAIRRGLIP